MNKKTFISKLLFLLALSILALSIVNCTKNDEEEDDSSSTDNSTQNSLVSSPLDALEARSEGVRPFPKTRFFAINKQTEYLVIGHSYKEYTSSNLFYIDPLEFNKNSDGTLPIVDPDAEDVLYKTQSEDYIDTRKKVAAPGTMDDDIQEEVAIISWAATGPGKLNIIDASGEMDATTFQTNTASINFTINNNTDGAYQYDLITSDVDGDGYDEIIIAGSVAGDTAATKLGKLWIIDDKKADHAILKTIDLKGSLDNQLGYTGLDRVRIAAGNVDRDGTDELIVAYALKTDGVDQGGTGKVSYSVFDDSASDYALLREDKSTTAVIQLSGVVIDGVTGYDDLFNVDMGDLDGDSRDEIVFIGSSVVVDKFYYLLEIIDDALGGDNLSADEENDADDAYRTIPAVIPLTPALPFSLDFFHVASIDADKRAEIITPLYIFDDLTQMDSLNNLPYLKDFDGYDIILSMDFLGAKSVTIGDTDGDFRNNIVILYGNSLIRTIGFEAESTYDSTTGELIETHLDWKSVRSYFSWIDSRGTTDSSAENPIIVCPNVDNDSLIVESSADNPDAPAIDVEESHTVHYGDFNIIAILSAPPYIPGVGQNLSDSSTSMSTSSGGSISSGVEASVRASVLIGFDVEISSGFLASMKVASVEGDIEATVEATGSLSMTKSVTKTLTYNAGSDDHQIVFTATPYDRYIYKIVGTIDTNDIGEEIVIDIPQETKIYSWTRGFYNANNGVQLDIGTNVLSNIPGNIDSYPTEAQKNEFLAEYSAALPEILNGFDTTWDIFSTVTDIGEVGPQTVPEGDTSSQIEVELGYEGAVGASISLSVDASFKACGAVVCTGGSIGGTAGVFSETTWATGFTFSGSVGGIESANYNDNKFEYGLFAYRQTLQDEAAKKYHDFIVLNYWVTK